MWWSRIDGGQRGFSPAREISGALRWWHLKRFRNRLGVLSFAFSAQTKVYLVREFRLIGLLGELFFIAATFEPRPRLYGRFIGLLGEFFLIAATFEPGPRIQESFLTPAVFGPRPRL
jgi:hypothetical protein